MLYKNYQSASLYERTVMTLEERDQLQIFLRQLLLSRVVPKDVAAESLIKEACSQHADALYLLVQRAMTSELALQAALAKNAELQEKLDPLSKALKNSPTQPATVAPSLWGSGMLGTVASTAVGVVAGSLLFEGIQSLGDDDWA
jgi:hypothetical protein